MDKVLLSIEIIVLGVLVLLSYYYIPKIYKINILRLWFKMPQNIIPTITVFMLLAVIGFLIFSYYNIFEFKITYKEYLSYGLILFPAIFWILLATKYLLKKKLLYKILTILSLILTALGSILMCMIAYYKNIQSFISSIFFSIQTVIWDAILWSYYMN